MKKIALTIAVAALLCTTSRAQAQHVVVDQHVQAPTPYHSHMGGSTVYGQQHSAYGTPVQRRYPTASRGVQDGNFFGELMELERRKNAWLRRTFLGR